MRPQPSSMPTKIPVHLGRGCGGFDRTTACPQTEVFSPSLRLAVRHCVWSRKRPNQVGVERGRGDRLPDQLWIAVQVDVEQPEVIARPELQAPLAICRD